MFGSMILLGNVAAITVHRTDLLKVSEKIVPIPVRIIENIFPVIVLLRRGPARKSDTRYRSFRKSPYLPEPKKVSWVEPPTSLPLYML